MKLPAGAHPSFRSMLLCLGAALALAAGLHLQAQPTHQEIGQLLASVQSSLPGPALATGQVQPPRCIRTANGSLKYISAPPQYYFPATLSAPGQPEAVARDFLMKHARLFGWTRPAVDFAHQRTRTAPTRHYIRLGQTYSGLPVFGAQATVQVDMEGGIECVLATLAGDFADLDAKRLSLTPTLSATEAASRVRALLADEARGNPIEVSASRLMVFAPPVVDQPGHLRLVWEMKVSTGDLRVNEKTLLDAHTGERVRRSPLNHTALWREIYDAQNTSVAQPWPVRQEYQGPCGLADADLAFQFFGDTYSFYWNHHHRDGITGVGWTNPVIVRYCDPNEACPWHNAMHSGGRLYFGQDYVTDDVMAHEFTHGVTAYESDLEYSGASGAINESFSDIWGEFVTWEYGPLDNSTTFRWIHGEDLPPGEPRRNMRDPTQSDIWPQPDRVGSQFYYHGTDDHGGVHYNNGINNKLCYLLTDGDSFNGQTVSDGVAAIYPGDNLFIRQGSYHEQLTITKALTLNTYDGPVTVGQHP